MVEGDTIINSGIDCISFKILLSLTCDKEQHINQIKDFPASSKALAI